VTAGASGFLREHEQGCTLTVRVQPGARKTAILGSYGDSDQTALKIALQAPPVDGRANEALVAFIAATLHIPKSSVQLLSGKTSRSKLLLLNGISISEADACLSALIP
jgi:uncharacterized protein